MYLLLSFCTTQFRALRATWHFYESLKGDLKAIGTTRQDEVHCGGKIVILDWDRKQIERITEVPRAAGLLTFHNNLLAAAYNKIFILDLNLKVLDQIDDHRFNNLHGLCLTPNGFAAASTGIDTILFLDESLRVYDSWCAGDHGFETDQLGNQRYVDMERDHRHVMYPTLLHTTHLNSLLWVDGDRKESGELYATFFHQGTVQKILPEYDPETIRENLRAPHALSRLLSGRFMVADSANNRLVIWGDDQKEIEIIDLPDCDWIQDAREIPNQGNYIVADCNHCRILEVDSRGKLVSEWGYDEDWKIQEVMILQTTIS